ncbi:hypothetical protein BKA61DRAFT_361460 [Leptodontidium sp. MPI-SDFR-AT-0119]|nr:hypothetical protein BKA61DRAFT_361460 [Leptodontidium sp. MPI-SDFR-AT-0119]
MCRLCTASSFVKKGLCVRPNRQRSISYIDLKLLSLSTTVFVLFGLAGDFVLCLKARPYHTDGPQRPKQSLRRLRSQAQRTPSVSRGCKGKSLSIKRHSIAEQLRAHYTTQLYNFSSTTLLHNQPQIPSQPKALIKILNISSREAPSFCTTSTPQQTKTNLPTTSNAWGDNNG